MQKLLLLLGAMLLLVSNVVLAQNCPANPTYQNQNYITYDLSAGRSVLINDGKDHNITIENERSSTSTICITNGSTSNLYNSSTNIIQPYQAFFVQSATSAGRKVNIDEAAENITTANNPFGLKAARQAQDALLEITLRVFNDDSTTDIADGVLYRFNDDYSNNVDGEDLIKMSNIYENLSILSNKTMLTVERRAMPQASDTLHLNLTNTKTTSYQLEMIPHAINKNMFLYDNYLKTYSPINATDTSRFTISINTANALSKAANRFSIVLQRQELLPVAFSSVRVYAKGKTAQVEWNVTNEIEVHHYEVERSANGTTFTKAGQVQATGATSYSFNDATPIDGTSYYHVKSVDKSGKASYTKVMPVTINTDAASSLTIYPNPLNGRTFQVQISNKAAGTYKLQLISNDGKQLFTRTISYNGSTTTYNVGLKNALASGLYFIKAVAADGSSDVIKIIVQ